MEVRILSENLAKAVNEAGRAIAKRGYSLPSAQCVLLETVQGRLRVTGTDLETAISVYSGAQVETEGKALIPAAMLGRILATFTGTANGAITLTPDGKHGLSLVSDGRTFKLAGQDPDDYPPVPDTPTEAFKVDGMDLRRALGRVLDAVATSDERPILQAVNFQEDKDGRLQLAVADGFRLAVHTVETDWGQAGAATRSDQFPEMNVPARTLREVYRLLPRKPQHFEDVFVRTDPALSHVRFLLKSQEVTAMLVQGTFPNYTQLIPTDWNVRAQVGTEDLRRELAAASVLASQDSGIVRFTLGPADQLTLAARAEEEGEFEAVLPAKVEGGEGKIAFNVRYVDDFLSKVGTDAVELCTTTQTAPGVFRPVGEDGYLQVIMPAFVQW